MSESMEKKIDSKSKNIYERKCPILYALDIVGQKWKLPTVWYLLDNGIMRYSELKSRIT